MPKLTLTDPANFSSATLSQTASNNAKIEAALENTLSRDGTSPNQMEADLDLNSNDILNAGRLNADELYLDGERIYPGDAFSPSDALIKTNNISDVSNKLTALENLGTRVIVDTLAQAADYSAPTAPLTIEVRGGTTAGDGGAQSFIRVASEPPTAASKFSITLTGGSTVWYQGYTAPYIRVIKGHMALQRVAIFFLTGQSNAAGAATGGDLTTNPAVLAYDPGTNTLVTANPQVAPFPVSATNNAGFHAAKEYQERHGGIVIIIYVGQGATSIDEWMATGNPFGLSAGSIWTRIESEVPAALTLVDQLYVDRIFFAQGESDSTVGCIVHQRKVETLLDQFRAQTWWLQGHTYVIASEPTQSWLNGSQTQGLALRLVAEKTSDLVVISSYDLPVDAGNPIHFSGEGLVELGHRYVETACLPYGQGSRSLPYRFSNGNLFFTVDPDGGIEADFTSLQQAFYFFSSVNLSANAVANVTIKGLNTLVGTTGIRPALINGSQWKFTGELSGSFSQPVKGDISATKGDALTYLRTQYLTEIRIASTMFLFNGQNLGQWKDILFSASVGANSSGCFQTSDGLISRNSFGGSARFINCAFHGWDGGAAAGAFLLPNGADVYCTLTTFAHCGNGFIIGMNGTFQATSCVFAYCTRDGTAQYGAVANVTSATTTSASASGWTVTTRAYMDARLAENTGSTTVTTNGIIQT